jgi:hypothetical protein
LPHAVSWSCIAAEMWALKRFVVGSVGPQLGLARHGN